MASKAVQLAAVVVLVMMVCSVAKAQSGCTSVLMNLSPCLNYVTGNSSTPSSSCCSQLSSVVQSQPQCLCALANGGGSSLGISINQTLALQLPRACNVQTPPVSRCNAANGPSATPVSPPSDSSDDTPDTDTPSTPNFPTGTGSKNVPDESHASINGLKFHLTFFVICVVSFAIRF